jgi:phospholipid transport system transporter-binding protein
MSAPPREQAEITGDPTGQVALRGPLTFETVAALHARAESLLTASGGRELQLNLQGVTDVDSAGLALLVGWVAAARAAGATLHFGALPERLLAIARISEVDGLLTDAAAARN